MSSMLLDSPVPTANQALRESFAGLLEKSFQKELVPGTIHVGEIIRVEKDGLMMDIGGKSEGFVPLKEAGGIYSYDELAQKYQVGQIHDCYILSENDNDSIYYRLSLRRVAVLKGWDVMQEKMQRGEIVDATITGITKGGVLVNVMNLKGFIPASQLRIGKSIDDLIGETVPTKILEVDLQKNKLILSNRSAVFEAKAALRAETLQQLKEGDLVEGDIVKVTDFGVFVDINGIDGLLPLSEISWQRIAHPSHLLQLGDRVNVVVLTVDHAQQRISLSKKRLEKDPWETVTEHFAVGDELNGNVTKILGSGVLIEMMPGVEAYCPLHGRIYDVGNRHRFNVVSINVPERRLTLNYVGDATDI